MGRLHRYGRDRGLEQRDHHPESGTRIDGIPIPQWEQVRDIALTAARMMPENPYVGWDVVVTKDGPIILEGNEAPHLVLSQFDGGLLADGRVRESVRRHQ